MKRQQDENFLQLFEIGGGPDAYLLELITGLNFCNRSNGQVARKDAVHAARNDSLPHIHVVVVGDVFHGEHGLTHSTDGVLDPGIGEFGAYAAFLVREQEHLGRIGIGLDRKSTRLNSSHSQISYAVFCLKKKTIDPSTLPACDPLPALPKGDAAWGKPLAAV